MFDVNELLSVAARMAKSAFRGRRNRVYLVNDVKSLAWQYAADDEGQHPIGCYVHFAIRDVREGRHFHATVRSIDSPKRPKGRASKAAEDTEFDVMEFASGRDPAEIAALKIDFEAWMETLTDRQRMIAGLLAVGNTTQDAANHLQCTEGNVSQYRDRLRKSWDRYIGQE